MAVHGQTRMLNAPAVQPFGFSCLEFSLENKTTQLSTVKALKHSPSQDVGPDCIITSKLTRRSNVRALCG